MGVKVCLMTPSRFIDSRLHVWSFNPMQRFIVLNNHFNDTQRLKVLKHKMLLLQLQWTMSEFFLLYP